MSIRSIQAKTGLISVKSMSELRELLTFSAKLVLNQLKLDNCVIQGPVGKDQRACRPNMQMSLGHFVGQ